MKPWKIIIVTLFYCNFYLCATHRRNKALYPAALRVRRGVASMVNPIFQSSINEVNLLFEILLAGLQFEDEHGHFSVRDEELASLRQTRKLKVICEDVVPRKLTEVRHLTSDLSQHVGALRQEDFERTVLTIIYVTQQLAQATSSHQRDAWAESFVNLYRALKRDLTAK